MTEERAKRKLSAVLTADVKGYSRLMGQDEAGTVDRLKEYRALMTDFIQQYRGRVVDSPGDNILAEFASVVDATECAVKIQEELKKKNSRLPDDRKMEFRIGINLGDIIEDGERIYGDGVNIAARIESLAEGGAICISGTSYDQVKNKLNLGFENLGEHSVKNIAEPIRVYRLLTEPEAAGKIFGEKRKTKKWVALAAVITLLIGVGVLAGWYFNIEQSKRVEPASVEKMAYPLPDKPSIAVLPFDNMSGDHKQDYFSDGLTEQIISALSKVPNLFVIARNSTFTFKGKPVKVQQVAEELGVRYVLEGSVQKAGDKVRITSQLVDALNGHHLWSESYDRNLKDIFAIQDEITMEIVTAMRVKLTSGEQARLLGKSTKKIRAYLKFLEGLEQFYRWNKEANVRAKQFIEEAITLDPEFGLAYSNLGSCYLADGIYGWSKSPSKSIKKASDLAQKALSLDASLAHPHWILGSIYLYQGEHKKAIAEAEQAVELNPNGAEAISALGWILRCVGRSDEAIPLMKKAIRLDPIPHVTEFDKLGRAYFLTGRYDEAISEYKKAIDVDPDYLDAHIGLASTYAILGRKVEAQAEVEEIIRINPNFSIQAYARMMQIQVGIESEIDGLRKAGLPEYPPLSLPDKPSIAVLPFVNISEDPNQEYFSDGLSDQIINSLSKIPNLFVIARNSTFTYKGKPAKVQKVAEDLGVRYVLEGSVQKSADRVRINAQLIDATTGLHRWSERYDKDLKDIFAIQDEITFEIIKALQVKLTKGDMARVTGKGTKNLDSYLMALQAHEQFFLMNRQGSVKAKQLAKEAIDLDPDYAFPYTTLANAHMLDVWFKFSKSPKESMKQADEALQKALALDDSDPRVHISFCNLYTMKGAHDKALKSAEIAVELSPSGARAVANLGSALLWVGRNNEAIHYYKQAIRLNPFPPSIYFRSLGRAYRLSGRYEDAVTQLKKALQLNPDDIFTHLSLILAYTKLDREEEAKAEAVEVLRIHPKFSVEYYVKTLPYKDQSIIDDIKASLRKSGLE